MSVFDKVFDLTQSIMTTDVQLKQMQTAMEQMQTDVRGIQEVVQNLGERVTRLEAQREADRAGLSAEIERFKHQVERAELRLQKPLPHSE